MPYNYNRQASESEEDFLNGVLKRLPKIRAAEKEGLELAEDLKKVLIQVRLIKQKYRKYRKKSPLEIVGDDELAEDAGFSYASGDEAVDLSGLVSDIRELLKMEGATDRLEAIVQKKLAK